MFPCSPKHIIGRKTLRELGLIPQPRAHLRQSPALTIDVNQVHIDLTGHIAATPWIEELPVHNQLKLMVRFPLLENVLMEPLQRGNLQPTRCMGIYGQLTVDSS